MLGRQVPGYYYYFYTEGRDCWENNSGLGDPTSPDASGVHWRRHYSPDNANVPQPWITTGQVEVSDPDHKVNHTGFIVACVPGVDQPGFPIYGPYHPIYAWADTENDHCAEWIFYIDAAQAPAGQPLIRLDMYSHTYHWTAPYWDQTYTRDDFGGNSGYFSVTLHNLRSRIADGQAIPTDLEFRIEWYGGCTFHFVQRRYFAVPAG